MIGISDKQGDMLAFIEDFVIENGYPPTREEIRTGLNISTKSLVNYHLEALETAALITRVPNTPRGLRLNTDSEAEKAPDSPKVDQAATEFPDLSQDDIIELTYGTVTNDNNLFALKIDDQSAGDVAILQRKSKVQNGEMVAVRLLDCNQTAIKHYFRENGHVRLHSINCDNVDIVSPASIQVEGKVVALIREVD